MKNLVIVVLVLVLWSCVKKQTYNCVTKNEIGFASATITSEKEFKGTHQQMLDYQNNKTTDSKTTVCTLK